jgi:4-hydroxy-2-oxoheptanedioate aldolase
MRKSVVKARLAAGEVVYTVKASYRDPRVVELMGGFGFDCVWICNEHIANDRSTLEAMVCAGRAGDIDTMVRIHPRDYTDVIQVLEMGANGLMLPQIKSAREVQELIREVRFPPLGNRKLDGIGADSGFGLLPLAEYLRRANEETFTVVQIETVEAIGEIDAIAAIPGVDVVFIGPGDLSLAVGHPGEVNCAEVTRVCEEVVAACRRHHKTPGIACGTPEQAEQRFQQGFRFLCGASDYRLVKAGLVSEQKLMNRFRAASRSEER